MKTTLKKLSIPKPNGGYDYLYTDDFATKEELAALKDTVYKLHFDKDEVTDLHPFYIKSLEDENVVYNSSPYVRLGMDAANVEYSYDGIWHNLADVESITLNKDERVYFRYIGEDYLRGNELISNPTKTFEVGGDLRSVIYGDMTRENTGNGHYRQLFYDLSNLVSAKNLKLGAELMSEECCFDMFCGCTSLVEAPELPATTLSIGCYRSMFQRCTSLVVAPKLPATKLARSCYNYMFNNCPSLISAPALPATTLAQSCYHSMFSDCTSLLNAPELHATELTSSCYAYMFEGCTSLVNAPELPATTLANGCYAHMFEGCTSLVNAPVLPATKLISLCYNTMFAGCSSLEKVEILAESGIENIYTPLAHMFNGCENLKRVFCNLKEPLIGDDTGTSPTNEWLNNVSPTGKFVKSKGLEWKRGVSGIPEGWEVEDWHDDYFYLESLDDEGVVTLKDRFGLADAPAEYTTDYITWQPTERDMQLNVRKGERVYIRRVSGNASFTAKIYSAIFNTETRLKIGGNVDKLMQDYTLESVTLGDYCYMGLFYNGGQIICNIVDASDLILPATTLTYGCYSNMFKGCTSLTTAPELPATTLASYCYEYMFYGCTSLVNAPELPATKLVDSCYQYMFNSCTSLTTAPELPATTLAYRCYDDMFGGCYSLVTAPELPATTLAQYCYQAMFEGCTSLVNAPELPATTMAIGCYSYMFRSCTSLTTAPELPATTLASYCYEYMFNSCKSLVTAPYLPAEKLYTDSYGYMFNGCSKLSEVKCNAVTFFSYSTEYWLSDVSKEGVFYQNINANWERGESGIPEGWIQQVITD